MVGLHHLVEGEGEPLLLIQGMSGTHVSWGEPFLGALHARGLQTIRYDHRGTGRSGRVAAPFTIVELAEDAAGLLDELGLPSAHVLGISMGGMVAQELALRTPQRVRTLALGCTYCGGPEGRLTDEPIAQRLAESLRSGDRERALAVAYELNLSERFRAHEERFASFHEMATTLPVAVEVIMLQMQAIFGHDTSARVHEIRASTLVIHGTEDQMLPVGNGELIARLIPGARLELLEGVGHMFWWEEPERSAELVAEHASASVAGGGRA
jgi:pimeloyl-ACP methyl ester carboxylesterase